MSELNNLNINDRRIKGRLATAIIVAIITAVATILGSVIGFAAATYQQRHNDTSISSGSTGILTFNRAVGEQTVTFDVTPSTGRLYVSAQQTIGTSDMIYQAYYKKSTEAEYNYFTTFSFPQNEIFSTERIAGSVKNGTKYNFKLTKKKGYGFQSGLIVDWLLK